MVSNNSQKVTINKIGGKNMSQMNEVGDLVDILHARGESVTLVVSAFTEVTNALISAMDSLNGENYSENDIDKAFSDVKELHKNIQDKFLNGDHKTKAMELYMDEYEKLRNALMAHKQINNILMPVKDSFDIRDRVIGFGEKMAGAFLKIYLEQMSYDAHFYDNVNCDRGVNGGYVSFPKLHEGMRGGIEKIVKDTADTMDETRKNVVRIFGGHIGNTPHGIAIDVGRSYSDTTAVNVGIALRNLKENVSNVRFWKDVDGVMTANPKDLAEGNKAVKHCDVSISEALEMASAGSDLMQIDALDLASQHNIDLEMQNIKTPEKDAGTVFSNAEVRTNRIFKSIITNPHVDTVNVTAPAMANRKGFASAIAEVFSKHGLSIDGIFTEGTSMSVSIPLPKDKSDREIQRNSIRTALAELRTIEVDDGRYEIKEREWSKDALASLAIIGNELSNNTGVLSEIAGVLSAYGIDIKSVTHGESQKRITLMIAANKRITAVQKLHSIFVDQDKDVIADYKKRRERICNELLSTYNDN